MKKYKGKFSSAGGRPGTMVAALVLILLALAGITIGGVAAYLSTSTGDVTNDFLADDPTDPSIVENFDGSTKTNVAVSVGDPGYAVYVRAAVVVTWKDREDGSVLGVMPDASGDYTIEYNTADWFYKDGFWYCKKMVNSGGKTPDLIVSCTPIDGKAPEGYGLNVEIISQTIQALGTTDGTDVPAVTNAWGVAVANGQLTNS